jgi:hypothetical protein
LQSAALIRRLLAFRVAFLWAVRIVGSFPAAKSGRGDTESLATAAEAAGPTVSQVFLAVRPCGSRNGCKRGQGQSKGQNNFSHRRLLWFSDLYQRQIA